jgi:uncharacterized protein (DUF2147 family)
MKKIVFLFALLLTAIYLRAYPSKDICGVWMSSDKSVKVQIYKFGNTYEGKVLWIESEDGKQKLDEHNPDPALRNRPMVGVKVLWGLVYNSEKEIFENGSAYVNGHTFCGKAQYLQDGNLKVTGYVCALKFLKKSEIFHRVN